MDYSVEEISQLTKILSIRDQSYLSEDVLFKEILPKLPVKSVVRFKCVSKSWLAEISSDSFIINHFHHHFIADKPSDLTQDVYEHEGGDSSYNRYRLSLIDDSNKISAIDISYVTRLETISTPWFLLGSSNGLVLIEPYISDENYEDVTPVLLNPATREFVTLPLRLESSRWGCHFFTLGFGEDCMNYKIVRVGDQPQSYTIRVQVFTKNSGRWREVGTILECNLEVNREEGTVVDGLVNWVIFKDGLNKILTFDLNTEELKVIDVPVSQSEEEYDDLEIIKWKGRLCALMLTKVGGEFHIWSKKNGLGGWTKMYVIEPPVDAWPFSGVLRDQLLFDELYIDSREYFLFDPVTLKSTPLSDKFGNLNPCNFQHYLPSLISPSYY